MAKAKGESLRRGKPETRSHYDRARDDFNAATGDARVTEGRDACPECGSPMRLVRTYKGKESYCIQGFCSKTKTHNIERFGYFSTEGS